MADVDLLLLRVRRFMRVRQLTCDSGLTGAHVLDEAFDAFDQATAHLSTIRNKLEHLDEVVMRDEVGFGFGITDGHVSISHRRRVVTTPDLVAAARPLHAAIRSLVDPVAELDVHGQEPIGPGDLTGTSRPP